MLSTVFAMLDELDARLAQTVDFDEIRRHYYGTHPMVNPAGLVAVMPDLDFSAPSQRAGL
jgi:putative glutathione S-transferase